MATQPWLTDPVVGDLEPPAAFAGGQGPRYGPPPKPEKPPEPKSPVFVPQGAKQMFDPNTNTYVPVPQAAGEDDPIKAAIDAVGIGELLSGVRRARKHVATGWATGQWGKLAELAPGGGTPRDDFVASLDTIQGGVIMEKLAALKAASATGASGLGALSEREGARLAASVAALDPRMSAEELERSFRTIERHALSLAAIREGKDVQDPAVQAEIEAHIGAVDKDMPGGGGGTGGDSGGAPQFTPAQEAEFKAFMRRVGKGNMTPEMLDAKVFQLLGKHPENAETWTEKFNEGGPVNTAIQGVPGEAPAAPEEKPAESDIRITPQRTGFMGDVDAFGAGAGDTLTLGFADELAGVGDAVRGSLAGQGSFSDIYGQSVDAFRGKRDMMAADNQWAYGAGQMAGGVGLPGAGARSAAQFARLGIGYGGVYGAGNAEGGFGNRAAGAVEGGAIGGALSYGVARAAPAVGNALSGLIARRQGRSMAPELANAAQAEGIDLYRPMVDPRSRGKFGALESDPTAQPIIRAGTEKVRGQIEDRVGALGQGGTARESGVAGEQLQSASRRYIDRTRGIKDRLYRRAENIAGDTRFVPEQALSKVDEEIARLSGNEGSNAAEIAYLQTLRDDLAKPGGKTVSEIRNLREGLRGEISRNNLTLSGAEARALGVLTAAGDDITKAIPAAGSAFKRADAFYRERQTMVDDIKQSILGSPKSPLDPQQAFAKVKTLTSAGGNARRLSAIMRHLEPSERQDIAATIAQSLGRDAADAPFSADKFISQTTKLSPRAVRTIFGHDGAESIANLRVVSQALKDAGGDINRSRSTTVANRMSPLKTSARTFIASLTGMGGYAAADTGGAIAGVALASGVMAAGAVRKMLSARAMMNPETSRWLAQAVNVNTQAQAEAAVKRLGTIINRQPALAGELTPIHQFLTQQLRPAMASDEANPE